MNAGHNYKLEMLAWKAVTEKDWGVVENNEIKIISYCDALHERVNMILECIGRVIPKPNTRLILFQNTVLGNTVSTFWCQHFKKDTEKLKRTDTITTVIIQVLENMPYNETLKYFVQKKIGELIQWNQGHKYL